MTQRGRESGIGSDRRINEDNCIKPSTDSANVLRQVCEIDYGKWDAFADAVQKDEDKERQRKEAEAADYRRALGGCAHDNSQERQIFEKPTREKLLAAERFRNEGNLAFQDRNYGLAAVNYRKALLQFDYTFPDTDEENAWMEREKLASHLNMAACKLKQRDWDETLTQCRLALAIDSGNAKALYRRGLVYLALDDYDRAEEALEAAQRQAPEDRAIVSSLATLKFKRTHYVKKRKLVYTKMFEPRTTGKAEGTSTLQVPQLLLRDHCDSSPQPDVPARKTSASSRSNDTTSAERKHVVEQRPDAVSDESNQPESSADQQSGEPDVPISTVTTISRPGSLGLGELGPDHNSLLTVGMERTDVQMVFPDVPKKRLDSNDLSKSRRDEKAGTKSKVAEEVGGGWYNSGDTQQPCAILKATSSEKSTTNAETSPAPTSVGCVLLPDKHAIEGSNSNFAPQSSSCNDHEMSEASSSPVHTSSPSSWPASNENSLSCFTSRPSSQNGRNHLEKDSRPMVPLYLSVSLLFALLNFIAILALSYTILYGERPSVPVNTAKPLIAAYYYMDDSLSNAVGGPQRCNTPLSKGIDLNSCVDYFNTMNKMPSSDLKDWENGGNAGDNDQVADVWPQAFMAVPSRIPFDWRMFVETFGLVVLGLLLGVLCILFSTQLWQLIVKAELPFVRCSAARLQCCSEHYSKSSEAETLYELDFSNDDAVAVMSTAGETDT